MKIVLAGGSGFLGRALRASLVQSGHRVIVLSRRGGGADVVQWHPDGTAGEWKHALGDAAAVVNLAGEGIADKRWSESRKEALRSSRLLATRSLAAAISEAATPPSVFVSTSAVGYYGARGDEMVTEGTPPGDDFLARLCVEWEREAEQASAVTRVALIRTGLPLHPDGGALAQMLLPFRLGAGGPMGSGTQFMPWIHLDDWVAMVTWLIGESRARGAFNGTAPEPVRNNEFAKELGRALKRPAFVPMPALALRALLGELSEALVTGQRAVPARALETGFTFKFPSLAPALADLLR